MDHKERSSSGISLNQASRNLVDACVGIQTSSMDTTQMSVNGRMVEFRSVRKDEGGIVQSGTISIEANGHEVKIECMPGYFVHFFDGKRIGDTFKDDNEEEIAMSKIVVETAKGLESIRQNKDDMTENAMRDGEAKRMQDLLNM
jgi:hypothetical protein